MDRITQSTELDVELTDLKDTLGTKGHLLVVRGDRTPLGSHKYWQYHHLIGSERIQERLQAYPDKVLFDGAGLNGLEAIAHFSKEINRKCAVVVPKEVEGNISQDIGDHVEIIFTDGQQEEGYIKKQDEVLKSRKDIIFLNQALYGAQSMAPVGNKVAEMLRERCITPDYGAWVIASGATLYGIGKRLQHAFPDLQNVVADDKSSTALESSNECVPEGASYHGIFPLHKYIKNVYLKKLWNETGVGFDSLEKVTTEQVESTRNLLKNKGFDWSDTSALATNKAIDLANEGKNVVVMAYAKPRDIKYRDLEINPS